MQLERIDKHFQPATMATNSKTAVKVVFGAMTIGKPGIEMTRVHTLDETAALLDTFQAHGHNEIDTSRVYGEGSSEEYLGKTDWQKRGIIMDTKLYPTSVRPALAKDVYSHNAKDLRAGLMASLKALNTDKLDLWYLHGPDRATPFKETLSEVNKLYEEGYFKRFGISNYQTWEVAKICEIAEANGWIKPTVYQGLYNAWHRAVEAELFPCMRHYGISLYCFNPLAGGFLTDRYHRDTEDSTVEKGSRYDPNSAQGKLHRGRYW